MNLFIFCNNENDLNTGYINDNVCANLSSFWWNNKCDFLKEPLKKFNKM